MKLRAPLIGAVLLAFLVAVPVGAHRHRPDHAVMSFGTEWNEGDVDGAVDLFEEDGVLSVPGASYAKGRKAVKKLLARVLERRPTLNMERPERELNYRKFWHWAIYDHEAKLTMGGETKDVIVTAVLIQTKDGPGDEDCKPCDEETPCPECQPCDEWSLVSLSIVEDSAESKRSR
jgi:hypothetical protein